MAAADERDARLELAELVGAVHAHVAWLVESGAHGVPRSERGAAPQPSVAEPAATAPSTPRAVVPPAPSMSTPPAPTPTVPEPPKVPVVAVAAVAPAPPAGPLLEPEERRRRLELLA